MIPPPKLRPAGVVSCSILEGACRYHEFRIVELNDTEDRTRLLVETVAEGRLRDFLGFNRARHAVVEAAILATRTAFLPRAEILAEFDKLAVIVAKTGGPAEHAAFRFLNRHVVDIRTRFRLTRDTRLMTRLSIRAGSRLHFGLMGWGPSGSPVWRGRADDAEACLEIVAEPASEWASTALWPIGSVT